MTAKPDELVAEARAILDAMGSPQDAFQKLDLVLPSLTPDCALKSDTALFADAWTAFGLVADRIVGKELGDLSRSVAETPTEPRGLFELGHALLSQGLARHAIPLLRHAHQLTPEPAVRRALTVACQKAHHYDEVVELLSGGSDLTYADRHALVFNTLLVGRVEEALGTPLGDPPDENWTVARQQLDAQLRRAALAKTLPGALSSQDLRGWHFTLTGAVLLHLSPYGFPEPMAGRYAMLNDSKERCAHTVEALATVLDIVGLEPPRIVALPDYDSEVIATALATRMNVPLESFGTGREDAALLVAYDLGNVADLALRAVYHRRVGQMLVEHASQWTDPIELAPDVCGHLHQINTPFWKDQGVPADPHEHAATILKAAPDDEDLSSLKAFTSAVRELVLEALQTEALRPRQECWMAIRSNQFR